MKRPPRAKTASNSYNRHGPGEDLPAPKDSSRRISIPAVLPSPPLPSPPLPSPFSLCHQDPRHHYIGLARYMHLQPALYCSFIYITEGVFFLLSSILFVGSSCLVYTLQQDSRVFPRSYIYIYIHTYWHVLLPPLLLNSSVLQVVIAP